MEKILKPISGFLALLVSLVLIAFSGFLFAAGKNEPLIIACGFVLFFAALFIIKGLMIINPNHSRVLNFFGKYVGTVKNNGLFFVNPLYSTLKVSLRAQNLQGQSLKVNDKMGNPIEIGAVIVCKVRDTYKAVYDVDDYKD